MGKQGNQKLRNFPSTSTEDGVLSCSAARTAGCCREHYTIGGGKIRGYYIIFLLQKYDDMQKFL